MARVVVMGGGVAGHTATTFLGKWLGKKHDIIVVTPNSKWNWIPSNIWVGTGVMDIKDVTFDLEPVYKKVNVMYYQAKATAVHPEGNSVDSTPYIEIEYTSPEKSGSKECITYDYLVNATGPKLNFDATDGLGPEQNTVSVCTAKHAMSTYVELDKHIEDMKKGEKKTIVVGTGHGTCTCQGAAFEYIFNLDCVLRKKGVRDNTELIWVSNEYKLGDFGMGGIHLKKGGYITSGKVFTESIMAEKGIKWFTQSHVERITKDTIYLEMLDGSKDEIKFDMAMLLPPFAGVSLKAFDKNGEDISSRVFAPSGFMKVDADYSKNDYDDWEASDWPVTYQTPDYKNIFAIGIAFAPPHPISKPMTSVNGTAISPAPPRTGMPSGMMGKLVAQNIKYMITNNTHKVKHGLSMAEVGAACMASTGSGIIGGAAVSMIVFPIVPDYKKYPRYGRDLKYTFGEVGRAGHLIKRLLHVLFLHKAKCRFGWRMIPE